MFRKLLDQGQAGDNIGVLLRGTKKEDVQRGQVLCKPGSITPHTTFEAQVYVLTKEEGGRHSPFFQNYRPQFYFRTTDVTGQITLPEGTEMVMPGDNIALTVELITPIAMDEGLRFAIREGGRTVGAGRVVKIIKLSRRFPGGRCPAVEWSHVTERKAPDGKGREAGQDHARVRAVQAPELHHHEEQAERPRAHGAQEVLPVGPDAHDPPGDPLAATAVRYHLSDGSEPVVTFRRS